MKRPADYLAVYLPSRLVFVSAQNEISGAIGRFRALRCGAFPFVSVGFLHVVCCLVLGSVGVTWVSSGAYYTTFPKRKTAQIARFSNGCLIWIRTITSRFRMRVRVMRGARNRLFSGVSFPCVSV